MLADRIFPPIAGRLPLAPSISNEGRSQCTGEGNSKRRHADGRLPFRFSYGRSRSSGSTDGQREQVPRTTGRRWQGRSTGFCGQMCQRSTDDDKSVDAGPSGRAPLVQLNREVLPALVDRSQGRDPDTSHVGRPGWDHRTTTSACR